MKAIYQTILLISLILFSCTRIQKPSDYKPFEKYDFENENYRLYGFISEGGGSDFFNEHQDFYIDSKEELLKIQNNWIFDSTDLRQPCGWEYFICLTQADSLLLVLKTNSKCNYLISDKWYAFNPDLWNDITSDSIKHLERDEARKIQSALFGWNKLKRPDPKVLVLPPYDMIANRGISPNIQKIIETNLDSVTNIELVKFPYKKMVGVPYQNVYDKKYCDPIIQKLNVDLIIMSKIELIEENGKIQANKWKFSIRLYNIPDNKQIDLMEESGLTISQIEQFIKENRLKIHVELIRYKFTFANTVYTKWAGF